MSPEEINDVEAYQCLFFFLYLSEFCVPPFLLLQIILQD
jgi:hypothetical protein